ncbi:MAG TPA: GAF domain-containing protein [Cytophagaceae bacterium]|nr:GAF domain-containing protein [Cytophagaceae bacterium]
MQPGRGKACRIVFDYNMRNASEKISTIGLGPIAYLKIVYMENLNVLSGFYRELYKKADKMTNYALVSFFVFGLVISFFYQTFLIAVLAGGLSLLFYYAVRSLGRSTTFYQYILSIIYAVYTAQFVYQMHGMLEMHFFAFIGAVLLIAYQNWRLHLVMALAVLAHDSCFAWLQFSGKHEIYFTASNLSTGVFLTHLTLVTIIIFLCGYWSYIFEKRNKESFLKGMELNERLSNTERNIAFADEISKGNLSMAYELLEGDHLGESLLKMRENLQAAYEKDQQDKFVNIGMARASEILRLDSNNLEALTNNILNFLIKYLEVNQGGLFVLNNTDPAQPVLELKACYAYNRKKFLEKKVEPGEGLVGQAYIEGQTIYLTEVPASYINITSGLGESNPRGVVIVPLKINDATFGIIEIASFAILEKYKVDFIEKIGESIATSISNAQVNEKTQKLLEESQQQAEMLRSQEEEMRQNMEELATTQEEMERKAIELDQIREEDKKRTDTQLENQKRIMEQALEKFKNSETLLKERIKVLEEQLENTAKQ